MIIWRIQYNSNLKLTTRERGKERERKRERERDLSRSKNLFNNYHLINRRPPIWKWAFSAAVANEGHVLTRQWRVLLFTFHRVFSGGEKVAKQGLVVVCLASDSHCPYSSLNGLLISLEIIAGSRGVWQDRRNFDDARFWTFLQDYFQKERVGD